MNPQPLRVVHYINQFFAGQGGEAAADAPLQVREGPVGPGILLQKLISPWGEVVGTLVCGDNAFHTAPEANVEAAMRELRKFGGQALVAGPAFQAGRYGTACAELAAAARDAGIPAITGMHEENPGLDMARLVPVVRTGANAAGMADAMGRISRVLAKLARGEDLATPEEEGIFPRARRNSPARASGAERAVDLLLDKLAGRAYSSEVPRPLVTELTPAAAVSDLEHARVALVTTGGVVPRGNPDHIESNNATHYAAYALDGLGDLDPSAFECIHSGFDTTYANLDPDRVVPIDAMRELAAEGRFGSLHDRWFVTTGNLTAIRRAEAFGRAIAAELIREGVQAVVLTAT